MLVAALNDSSPMVQASAAGKRSGPHQGPCRRGADRRSAHRSSSLVRSWNRQRTKATRRDTPAAAFCGRAGARPVEGVRRAHSAVLDGSGPRVRGMMLAAHLKRSAPLASCLPGCSTAFA
jgi:hypothetical protein